MTSSLVLNEFIPYVVIFTRVLGFILIMPVFGHLEIPVRFRVMTALALSVLLSIHIPFKTSLPSSFLNLFFLMMSELVVGFFVGIVSRTLVTILDITGSMISFQIGLSNAMVMNPAIGSQGFIPSTILVFFGLSLFLNLDLHHLMLRGFLKTYELFPVNQKWMLGDFSKSFSYLISTIFNIGVQMAFPFIIVFVIMQLGLGLINKMVPQMQVFFVGMPLQVVGGLFVFMLVSSGILTMFSNTFEHEFKSFFHLG